MMETVCIGQGWCSFHDWVGGRETGDDGTGEGWCSGFHDWFHDWGEGIKGMMMGQERAGVVAFMIGGGGREKGGGCSCFHDWWWW